MTKKSVKEVLMIDSGSLVKGSNILSQADRIPITACEGGGGQDHRDGERLELALLQNFETERRW
jgi:hypothetical protein